MVKRISILACIAFLLLPSCKKPSTPGVPGGDVKICASFERTKAEMSDDLSTISWVDGDNISVFDSRLASKYVALSSGALSDFIPEGKCIEDYAEDLFALYPYQSDAVRDGNRIFATVPIERSLSATGLDANSSVAVAYSNKIGTRTELVFRNICSYLQVYIPASDNIVDVRMEGGENEFLAGQVELTVAHNGVPSITVVEGSNVVTMHAEDIFSGYYIFPILPCTLQNGLKMVFVNVNGNEKEHRIIAKDANGVVSAVTFVRNKINKQALDFEVVAPNVALDKVFWSDARIKWECSGCPVAFNILLDGELVATVDADTRDYQFLGLEPGSTHNFAVSSIYEREREAKSADVSFTTGAIRQLTTNLSPTSVSVEIENMTGTYLDNYHPCLYVELLDSEDESVAAKIYETHVLDAQIQSPASAFFGGLAIDEKKSKNPLRIAMGSLEPGKDYWFRVKSVARHEFKSYLSATPTDSYAESTNGDSAFSTLVKLSTPQSYAMQNDDILYQGFDDFMIHPDYLNGAVGSVPAYKAAGKKNSDMSIASIKGWTGQFSFYGPRTAFASSQVVHYGWAAQQTVSNDVFTISGGVIAGNAPLAGAKVYSFKAGEDGLQGWMISNNTYPCQGYVALGAYYNVSDAKAQTKGMIVTPALESPLLASQTECELSFKGFVPQGRICALAVWHYDGVGKTWTKLTDIDLYNTSGTTEEASTWSCKSEGNRWYTHSLSLKLKNGDRIALASDGNGTALIDEINLKIK